MSVLLKHAFGGDCAQIGECLGVFWRPNFTTLTYPYRPPHIERPKEVIKLFLVPLPEKCYFAVWPPSCTMAPRGTCCQLGEGVVALTWRPYFTRTTGHLDAVW
jgi:Nucleotide hydrolase